MVDSLSPSTVKIVARESNDSEIAACIAAVTAYIQIEDEERRAREAAQGADKERWHSAWGRQALLEGAQVANDIGSIKSRGSLWRNFLIPLAFAVGLTSAPVARAADASDETMLCGYSNGQGSVTAAPLVSRSADAIGGRIDATKIKVALAINASEISFDAVDGARVFDVASGQQLATVQPLSKWKLCARTTNGDVAVALAPRREVDKLLIDTSNANAGTQRNVGFFFAAASSPPPLKALQAQTDKNQVLAGGKATLMLVSPASQSLQVKTAGDLNSAIPIESADGSSLPDELEVQQQDQSSPSFTACDGITGGVMISPETDSEDGAKHLLSVNGRFYRGNLWLKPCTVKDKNGAPVARFTAINVIDLEDYLKSVLPSEMPSSWHSEALKAQAIAARSYALANLGKYRTQGFDVKPTVDDQAYRGAVAETAATNKAVAATTGIVMKHRGKIVPGFFHSTSAGATDVAEHVWTKEVPYLKSVPDVDHKSKYVLWERKFATLQIDKALGKEIGNVLGLFAAHRSPSGRVKQLLVVGTRGSTFVPGSTIRQLFALPSTNFNVLAYQDAYVFKGQGFGHGLGMSQWGARSLAEHGYNAAQILTYYYKDVTFEKIVETSAL
ncbi:MAG: SpoIID/LytB domain-containing protein [Candidatus Obscuribacterales bacterium]|nr:SpoIID/LytB domain-containing protein [Candidatus Obscuribacterales bacterium]